MASLCHRTSELPAYYQFYEIERPISPWAIRHPYQPHQFLVDSPKMANAGVPQRKCPVADRAFERLVSRVCLPVPE